MDNGKILHEETKNFALLYIRRQYSSIFRHFRVIGFGNAPFPFAPITAKQR